MTDYNRAYQELLTRVRTQDELSRFLNENTRSLRTHLDKVLEQFSGRLKGQKTLELGCGGGALTAYLAELGFESTGLDIAKEAIKIALALSERARYRTFDVCQDITLTEKFDLMVDGHLLHCLTGPEKRKNYYQFVKNNLADGGFLVGECMSLHRDLKVPVEYSLDERGVLSHQDKPIRRLLESRELEEELIQNGFRIEYFYYHAELSFEVYPDYPDFPPEYLPKTIRFACGLAPT